mmetsp:Transcript_24778/g.65040  ORF Transcript_24778/g.65040 Transcript_24778/m.65040 type:complete len:573 (-) Transcript_24778:93-1811(-)
MSPGLRNHATTWGEADVQVWLMRQGLANSQIGSTFAQNQVDGKTLLMLTPDDIREELQIQSLFDRKKLWDSLEQLRYIELNRDLKAAVNMQQEDVATCTAGLVELDVPQTSQDFEMALSIFSQDLQNVEGVVQDAECANHIHGYEVSKLRTSQAGQEAAVQLQHHLGQVASIESSDATAAQRVARATGEHEISNILREAEAAAAQAGAAHAAHTAPSPPSDTLGNIFEDELVNSSSCAAAVPSQSAFLSGAGSSTDQCFVAASLGGLAGTPVRVEARAPQECCSCLEKRRDVRELPCKHKMCNGCLRRLFENASHDSSLLPVRCCRQHIDPSWARELLNPRKYLEFVSRLEERMAIKKMYCVNPYCSQWINLDHMDEKVTWWKCTSCDRELCVRCHSNWHTDATCEEWQAQQIEDSAEVKLAEMAERQGWRRCRGCGVMVQLSHGCNHMTCRCGQHFCYACGEGWPTSSGTCSKGCALWSEAHLVVEEERIVQAVEREEHRPVLQPERQEIRRQILEVECDHSDPLNFKRKNYGWGALEEECSNCGFHMAHYCYKCRRCRDRFCFTCVHHRL